MIPDADIIATQNSAVLNALVELCGAGLTSPQINRAYASIVKEMREGASKHAFNPSFIRDNTKEPEA